MPGRGRPLPIPTEMAVVDVIRQPTVFDQSNYG